MQRAGIVAVAAATIATSRKHWRYDVPLHVPDPQRATKVVVTASEEPHLTLGSSSASPSTGTLVKPGTWEYFVPAGAADGLQIDAMCKGSLCSSDDCEGRDRASIRIDSMTSVGSWKLEAESETITTTIDPAHMHLPTFTVAVTGDAELSTVGNDGAPLRAGSVELYTWPATGGRGTVGFRTTGVLDTAVTVRWRVHAKREAMCPGGVATCSPPATEALSIVSVTQDAPP